MATVSFVVNGSRSVGAETRARVELSLAELGFHRNVLARALASQRTQIIALVFPAVDHRLGSTAMSIVTSASVAASERGFNLVLWPVSSDPQQLKTYVMGGLVDAVLLMEVTLEDPRIDVLEQAGLPFVLMGRPNNTETLSYVDMDFEGTVASAIDHLTEQGHSAITLLIGEIDAPALVGYTPIVRTTEAYQHVMRERGLTSSIIRAHQDPASGRAAARELMTDFADTTAVLVLNEQALYGFVGELGRAGMRLPDDLSVLGMATSPDPIARADPVVSSFVAPGEQMGRLAIETVIDQLDNTDGKIRHLLVGMNLREAGSTGARG